MANSKRWHFLNLSPERRAEFELMDEFKERFGLSPLIDHDALPHAVLLDCLRAAVETGFIPEKLARRLMPGGFITSIVSNDNPWFKGNGEPPLSSIVLNLPHASTRIPRDIRSQFLLNDDELSAELLAMTDMHTHLIYPLERVALVVDSPVSRLVCDSERFADDAEEPMASRGMGAIYMRTSTGRPLRRPLIDAERASLLHKFHQGHHQELTRAVGTVLEGKRQCLVLDGHSFPSVPLPYELDQSTDRPQFCIGADDFHTPASVVDVAVSFLRDNGFDVAVNRPFSGALVPAPYYRQNPRVHALMIEVRRDLYMNERTGLISSGMRQVRAAVRELAATLQEAMR